MQIIFFSCTVLNQTVSCTLGNLDRSKLQLLVLSSAGVGAVLCYLAWRQSPKTIPIGDGWWGAGEKPSTEDKTIHRFVVKTSVEETEDLHRRIDQTRFTDPLEDSRFNYGFNSNYLRRVLSYWRHQFDWEKQVKVINQYPHFKTKIEGIDVHFIHVRPVQKAGQTVLPLMMVHGWPGSFYEFYKIIPLLTKTDSDAVFEVICPSIPGYGYSEAPHKKGKSVNIYGTYG
uniref:Epoxide hydrolase 1-like n=1 Tax=Sinocyclocheilus anshuiensis TaxID=1608454 RepID=A0A671KK52_9TELE